MLLKRSSAVHDRKLAGPRSRQDRIWLHLHQPRSLGHVHQAPPPTMHKPSSEEPSSITWQSKDSSAGRFNAELRGLCLAEQIKGKGRLVEFTRDFASAGGHMSRPSVGLAVVYPPSTCWSLPAISDHGVSQGLGCHHSRSERNCMSTLMHRENSGLNTISGQSSARLGT